MNTERTAVLIRCSAEESAAIRAQAAAERRTISGCILNVIERGLTLDERYSRGITESFLEKQTRQFRLTRHIRTRANMLLRCSAEEAERVRAAARRRSMSISEFVLFSLWRHWDAVRRVRPAALPLQSDEPSAP